MKKLKTILIFLVVNIVVLTADSYAQDKTGNSSIDNPVQTQPNGRNLISCSAYDAIKYNGHTISQINATGGIQSIVQSLLGSYTTVNENDTSPERLFLFDETKVAFNTESGRLTTIEILNNYWPVEILGKELKVGDQFNQLKLQFGNNSKVIYKPTISDRYVVSFNCSENDYDGLLIYFDPATDEVDEIKYYKRP